MSKRLSASGPQPRPHFAFPGYPTLAAAGLYLCLSGGCSGGNATGTAMAPYDSNPPPPPPIPDAAVPDVVPPTPDAAAPDVLPPAPDGDDGGSADHEDATIPLPDPTGIP